MLLKCFELFCGAFFLGLGTLMFLKPERYSKGENNKIKNIKIRGIITCICGVLILVLSLVFLYIDK